MKLRNFCFGIVFLLLALPCLGQAEEDTVKERFQLRFRVGYHGWQTRGLDISTLDGLTVNLGFWFPLAERAFFGVEVSRLQRERYIGLTPIQSEFDRPPRVNLDSIAGAFVFGYHFTGPDARWRPYIAVGGGMAVVETLFFLEFPNPEIDPERVQFDYNNSTPYGLVRAGLAFAPNRRYALLLDAEYQIGHTMAWEPFGSARYQVIQGNFGVAIIF